MLHIAQDDLLFKKPSLREMSQKSTQYIQVLYLSRQEAPS